MPDGVYIMSAVQHFEFSDDQPSHGFEKPNVADTVLHTYRGMQKLLQILSRI